MTFGQSLHDLPQAEQWGLLLFSLVIALASLYYCFRWFIRARMIEDTPTARIRSAQQGYVELVGQVSPMAGEPVLAPLTGTACCWYRYQIEKRGNKHWHSVESDTSDALFLLRDETGECLIDPEGAEVTPSDRSVWYGNQRYPRNRAPDRQRIRSTPLLRLADRLNRKLGAGRYRYREERIYAGDRLYAIGLFKSLDELDHRQHRAEWMRGLLREWKQDQAQLLARFDLNRDGALDSREWTLVRTAADNQARLAQRQQEPTHCHRLGATDSRHHPFLLSTLAEFGLVRRYRWQAGGALLLFFISGSAAVWLLGLRLSL